VDVVVHNERDGLEGIILQPYTYLLEFFAEDTGYGPLLCYREFGICRFEQDTLGRYIEVPDEFFEWIEEGLKKQSSKYKIVKWLLTCPINNCKILYIQLHSRFKSYGPKG